MSTLYNTIRVIKIEPLGLDYRVTISSLDRLLIIPGELLHEYRLKEGIVLTTQQLDVLLREAELAACERQAMRYLALRDRAEGELRMKLRDKRFGNEAIDTVIKRFHQKGLIDDARVAFLLLKQVLDKNPAGRSFLIAYLRKKYIEQHLAEQTVDLALVDRDELDIAVEMLQSRWIRFSKFDLEDARRKAYYYLSRRGVGFNAAKEAFDRVYNQQKHEA